MHQPVIEKVRKLFALAHGGATESEAQSAILLAQRMLMENGLSMDDLEGHKSTKTKEAIDEYMTDYEKTPWWKVHLGVIIGKNFRCYSYRRMNYGRSRIILFGLPEDVKISKEVFTYGVQAVEKHFKHYKTRTGLKGAGVKNDWIGGFLDGLADAFEEQIKREDWGLILVKDKTVIDAYQARQFKKSPKRSAIRTSRNDEAKQDGYRNGQRFANSGKEEEKELN